MQTKILRVSDDVYKMVAKVAREKAITFTESLELLLREKQDLPGTRKEEIFNLGVLQEQHFVYQEFIGEEYVCADCMEAARKKYPFLLTHTRTRHCYMRGRDEVEKHFKEKHPDVIEILDKGR